MDDLAALAVLFFLLKGAGTLASWEPFRYTGPKRGPFGKGEVERVRTRVALNGLEQLFQTAIREVLGQAHGWGKLARMFAAQARVESGAQLGSLYHFNFGNVTTLGDDGEWYRNPPGGKLKFRVFNTPAQGAEAMAEWVGKHAREALTYGELGDAAGYAREVGRAGYFGAAPLADYQRALGDRFREGTPS